MYPVPLGDERTNMGKRQRAVFYADSMPTRGSMPRLLAVRADSMAISAS